MLVLCIFHQSNHVVLCYSSCVWWSLAVQIHQDDVLHHPMFKVFCALHTDIRKMTNFQRSSINLTQFAIFVLNFLILLVFFWHFHPWTLQKSQGSSLEPPFPKPTLLCTVSLKVNWYLGLFIFLLTQGFANWIQTAITVQLPITQPMLLCKPIIHTHTDTYSIIYKVDTKVTHYEINISSSMLL